MVFLWIGIGIGVLIATILIVKAVKTNSRDVLGMEKICKICGAKTDGLNCPKCKKQPDYFGV